ncbi:MAG: phytanoyl-CoA dioxygenase family protein [Caulobacterales bacterium]
MNRLTEDQKRAFRRDGCLLIEGALDRGLVEQLAEVMDAFVERSRSMTESSADILLAPDHTAAAPKLRRIPQTVAFHPVFEAFGLRGPIVDLAEDLLGPDVRFHHSKLNFKSPLGGEEIKWHQDIQFWPHSNYAPLTIGVYLTDVDADMAPMGVVAGSHEGPIFELRDAKGDWTGAISDEDLRRVDFGRLKWLTGPRGSITVHSCRSVHGSAANNSSRMRPLLLHTYAPCDALPLTNIMDGVRLSNVIVRGQAASFARFGEQPCPMPPDWSAGRYSSIFSSQRELSQ